jgi:hypothetical protein
VKPRLPRDPFLVLVDFAPALEAAARAIFPGADIGHDYFHAAQLLGRGLLKELTRLYRAECAKPVAEFHAAARASLRADKGGTLPALVFTQPYLQGAWEVYREIHALRKCRNPASLEEGWERLCACVEDSGWPGAPRFLELAREHYPRRGMTRKGQGLFLKKVRGAWRATLREAREVLEDRKASFAQARYLVLKNPANMRPEDTRVLRAAMVDFPFLRPIREIVTRFHYQFKAKPGSWRPLDFLRDLVHEDSHDMLRSAVETLIAKQGHIFAYRQLWGQQPCLMGYKGARTTREEANHYINSLARTQFGFRSSEGARMRLAARLHCPFIVSKSLRIHEASHL